MSFEPVARDRTEPAVDPDDPLADLPGPDQWDGPELSDPDYDDPAEWDGFAVDRPGDDPYLHTADDIGDGEPVLLVWPHAEFAQIDLRWPEVLEPIGTDTWEDYRRHYQALITRWTGRGLPLLMVCGTAEGFAEWLREQGADPVSVDLVAMADAYGGHLSEQGTAVELPPAGDDPCWCGSGERYHGCCRLLSRDAG